MKSSLNLSITPLLFHMHNSPFETMDFSEGWNEHLKNKFKVMASFGDFIIHQKNLVPSRFPVALMVNELRLSGWNTAWWQCLSNQQVNSLIQNLDATPWDYFRITVLESSRKKTLRQLNNTGLKVIEAPASPIYLTDLSAGYEKYIRSRSAKRRRDIRRKLNRAAQLEPQLIEFSGGEKSKKNIHAFFKLFFEHHLNYWDQKSGRSYFRDPREQRFILDWAHRLQTKGQLKLNGMLLNHRLAYMSMDLQVDDTLYLLLCINTGIYREYFPGILYLYMMLEKAAQMGIRTVNMGPGEYAYKAQAATRIEPCHTLLIANPKSIKGLLYTAWLRQRLNSLHNVNRIKH